MSGYLQRAFPAAKRQVRKLAFLKKLNSFRDWEAVAITLSVSVVLAFLICAANWAVSYPIYFMKLTGIKNSVSRTAIRLNTRSITQSIAWKPLDLTSAFFLFMNVSSTHQPNCMYVDGAKTDSIETQIAAMKYTDTHLGKLFDFMRRRSKTLAIVCSDHGTAYGEDGYWGHRVCHSAVWTVPYAEFVL